jgi:TonB-linked SusC/RagA family outer membrane protein
VDEVLKELLKGEAITWEVFDRNILLRIPEAPLTTAQREVMQQQKSVSGTVTDESDQPLPGVTVLVKGTTQGTVTNGDGEYSINNIAEDATLQFSFVGMLTQEIEVNNRSTINVQMETDAIGIEEVVAIGYGVVKKSDLTGSVSAMKEDDFNPGGNISAEQLIQGKTPGAYITQTSAEPGGGMSVKIRGITSANASSEPLYVIDGLPIDNSPLLSGGGAAGLGGTQPRNPLNSLNPSDIQSIEILKDASATAIYGARGANGVILITTKQGKEGTANINYEIYTGFQNPIESYELLNANQYMTLMNDLAEAEGRDQVFSSSEMQSIQGTDWLNEILRTAPIMNHNLSASGGSEKLSYFASLNYFDQQGIVKNTGIKRYVGRLNLDHKISDKATMGLRFSTSIVDNNNSIDGTEGNNESSGPLFSALLYDPTEPVYNENGELSMSPNLTIQNPMRLVKGISSNILTNRTTTNGFVELEVVDGLTAKLNAGLDRISSRKDLYSNRLTFQGASSGGMADVSSLERSNTLLEYTMNYNKQIGEQSNLSVLGGVTYQHFMNRYFGAGISGFPSDDTKTNNLNLGNSDNDYVGSNKIENKLLSYLTRVNYSLMDKYLFTASFRADGSSRFGPNNRFGYFPSFAAAWRLSNEEFIPELFYNLKLRASWGQIGNEAIGNLEYISTLQSGSRFAIINDNEVRGIQPSRVANPNLKWETTEQIDIGVDLSIFEGRFNVTADYFIKNTKDMLYNMPLPESTGFGSKRDNIGSMRNQGIELLVNSINIQKRNFDWSTTLNFTTIKNEVTSLGGLNELVAWYSIIKEGEPLHSYYGYTVLGMFQQDDNIAESAQPGAVPGQPKFKDINNDNKIDAEDMSIIGKPMPDFTYGLQSSLSYKNFQFDFFIQGQEGASLLNYSIIESLYPQQVRRNRIATTALDRWTVDNPDAKWPSMVNTEDYGGGRLFNTLTLLDASYIRLKNVKFSYDIPIRNSNFLKYLQVYVTGQNLLTITDYVGPDPESNSQGRGVARLDKSSYPQARTWLFGAKVHF